VIGAKVIADSLHMTSRLTSFELVYPRFIHSELMTYCTLARNSASSRAIPIKKMIEAIQANPAMPVSWGKNQKGMVAEELLSPADQQRAALAWVRGSFRAIETAEELMEIGVHKQIANRPLEPFMHMQTVLTGTDIALANLYHQRTAGDAQPEFQALAEAMLAAQNASRPEELYPHYPNHPMWHLPYVSRAEALQLGVWDAIIVSVARCARASYTNQGKVYTLAEDQERFADLCGRGHWSPLEHVAEACWWNVEEDYFRGTRAKIGKFPYFHQLRHRYHDNYVTKFARLLDPLRPPEV
jgi:thymidylate synthase ThyX